MISNTLQASFQALITEHKGILVKVCNLYCRNRDDGEDLAQEITLQLWRSFESFDGRARFSTWMYRVALNVAISYYRRETTRSRYVLSGDELLLENAAGDLSAPLSDQMALLYRSIERLDPLSKALVLLYLDGNTYLEIAEILGISETNVATKISRLKTAMKEDTQHE